MTTQWNPAGHQGEPGAGGNGNGEDTGADAGTGRAETDPGPWRVYTMPVPEHPDHSDDADAETEPEEPGYDGITGYPAPAGPGGSGGPGERSRHRSTGRHARPTGPSGGLSPEDGDDDPDGLAGWVGSLTDAADDARIAGRTTGAFPAVSGRGAAGRAGTADSADATDSADAAEPQPSGAEGSWTETVQPESRSEVRPRPRAGATPAEGSWTETVRPWATRPETGGTGEASAERTGAAGGAGSSGVFGTAGNPESSASEPADEGPWATGGGTAWREDTPSTGTPGSTGPAEATGVTGASGGAGATGGQSPWRDGTASGAAGTAGHPGNPGAAVSGTSAHLDEGPWATGDRTAWRQDTPGAENGTPGPAEATETPDGTGRSASATATAEGAQASGDPAGDLLADDPAGSEGRTGSDRPSGPDAPVGSDSTTGSAASADPSDPADPARGEAERGPDDPEPLPHRVPGTSPMSGAFRAVNPNGGPNGNPDPGPYGSPDNTSDDHADGGSGTGSGADEGSDEPDYRPTNHETWRPARTSTREELVERLEALAALQDLGEGELPSQVTERATQLLEHAGARLRLSGDHTVVALAGGTGSGKSSLFNALCGLELSQTGITRPTTSKAHACVWGHEGADELLSWLGVPPRYRHSRTGVLDSGNSEMNGLVLLDLPDHDSVRSMHTAEADRLIGSVDLLVWVLDPQKYADAAVHHRYLAKMAGHGAVTVAVLNQVDRVGNEELEELLTDLRRLLESESGVHPRIITTSTTTDQGVDDLRDFLVETVHERRALVDRLDADLNVVIGDFEPFQGEGEIPTTVSTEVRSSLQKGLSNAAGVSAVADVTEANDVRRGRRQVGWPVARRLAKLRKDPLAAVQLDFVRRDTENGVSARVDAHEAELEKSLVEAADSVSEGMPSMWRRRMRGAARSGVEELPTQLGESVDAAVRGSERTPSWWGFARLVQYVLLGVAGVGAAWALVSAVSWLGGGITGLRVFDDPVFIAYSGAVVAASLLVGWLTGVGCGNLVDVAAVQRREEIERTADASLREIAGERVVRPLEAELERFRSFRRAYETARGPAEDGSGG